MNAKTTVTKNYAYLWGGRFMYLGRFEDITEHAHHALQIIVNRGGLFQLKADKSSIECSGAIIGADRPHQLLSSGDSQIHLWIDKEATAAKMISERHLKKKGIKILDGPLLKRLKSCPRTAGNCPGSCKQAIAVYRRVLCELGGCSDYAGEPIDPRIVSTIRLLREKYLSEKLNIAYIARHACLSESRLIHLFTEQVGIPLRRYVLWMRLLTALRMSAQGEQSLTEAAHNAGFSDSAHLSRTSRSMFGISPSGCANSQFVEVYSCFS